MTIFSRILAFLNIIAAIVTVYMLAQVYVARLSWQRALRAWEARRDGVPTNELRELVRQDFAEQVEELEKNPPQSEEALRRALLEIIFPRDKPELLADEKQTEERRQRYGLNYDDVRLVVEDRISRTRNELRVEEESLVNRRRELELLRAHLEDEIKQAEERLMALENQIKIEQGQHDKITKLIRARWEDIAFWRARLAEAFAARQLAEARWEDMVAERKRLEAARDQLKRECQILEQRISDLEKQLARGRQ